MPPDDVVRAARGTARTGWTFLVTTDAMSVVHAARMARVDRVGPSFAYDFATACRSNGIPLSGFVTTKENAKHMRRCRNCCRLLGVEPGLGPMEVTT